VTFPINYLSSHRTPFVILILLIFHTFFNSRHGKNKIDVQLNVIISA